MVISVACGGGEERASTIESVAANQQSGRSVSPTPEKLQNVSREQLNSALLTLGDLPTGWTTTAPQPDNPEDNICDFDEKTVSQPLADLKVDFQRAETGPFLVQTLQSYEGDGAEKVLSAFLEKFQSCSSWTTTDDKGKQTKWQVSGLSFPKSGDQTIAMRIASEATILGILELDFVVIRRGRIINAVGYGELGFKGIDSSQTEQFVKRADEKLQSLGLLR
jgi:hypothetical protein